MGLIERFQRAATTDEKVTPRNSVSSFSVNGRGFDHLIMLSQDVHGSARGKMRVVDGGVASIQDFVKGGNW